MAKESDKPLLVMFAGPNGSGKSTVTPLFQNKPNFPQNYINPDEIALTLGGNTMEKAYEASAIAAQKRLQCIEEKQSFSFETVMSHPSKLAILETAKAAGFETQLVFISTQSPLANVERVKQRVLDGGHDVPRDKIISRYHRSMSFLPKASEIANRTYIFDNSDSLKLEAVLSQGQVLEKPGKTVKWVENILNTLNERQQERLTVDHQNNSNLLPPLDKGEYTGRIDTVGDHFSVQQTKDGQLIIHENSVLNLDKSAVGHEVLISYLHGVHKIEIPELSIDTSQTLEDTLFNLASSLKYIVLNEGLQDVSSDNRIVYKFPSGIVIEKDSENLSISYDDKSIQFDQDFNVVQNKFSNAEIRQLEQQAHFAKQHSLEQSRSQQIQIQKDIDLSW